jgi:hypothetical protein
MSEHKVYFDLPTRELGKADVHFTVKKDGAVLGKLEVSKGALVWYPKNARRGHKVGWTRFHEFATARRKSEKRKPR